MKIPGLLHFPFVCITFFILGSFVSCSSLSNRNVEMMDKIIEVNAASIPDSVTQLVLVYNENQATSQVILFTLKKQKGKWIPVMNSIPAGIGENGFAAQEQKQEGDGKTPTGLFKLGQLFTYEKQVDTRMPFTTTTSDDKWIDDPESADYNRHVRGETTAKSYENLKLASDHYKFCMVIEYNTNPVIKGKGSAIFFHLRSSGQETTAGCVAISEKDMLQIMKWLDPDKHPMILMGSFETLTEDSFAMLKSK